MTELLAVVAITCLAVLSPGPDFAMVSRNSLLLSRHTGVVTAVGIGLGVVVHVTYTLLGVGLLIQQSLLLFNSIKLAGAAYLIYLGVRMLRSRPGEAQERELGAPLTTLRALRMGFLTNVLNPKTTIFIVSLFLQVVQPATPLAVQLGYGAFIVLAHVLWFAAVAIFFSSDAVRARLLAVRHRIDQVFGAVLVGFGALLAAASR